MARRLLMIDNYDSFTYNLVQYLAELGADVEVRRNDAVGLDEVQALAPDGIVISPGPCTPREAGVSVPLIQRFAGQIPILGVCLGHQAIGAAFGGDVVRAPRIMHGKTSPIRHDGTGVFAGLPDRFDATRYHSLVIDPATLPPVPHVSMAFPGTSGIGTACARSTRAAPTSSSTCSPFWRSPTRSAATCAGVASPRSTAS